MRRFAPWGFGFFLWLALMLGAAPVRAHGLLDAPAEAPPPEPPLSVDYDAALGLEGLPVPEAPPAAAGWAPARLAPEAPAAERLVWDRTPIPVVLPVGRERRVDFPAPIAVGLPAGALPEGSLRTQSVDGSLYWLASQPFGPVRVQVREIDSGRVVLLDLEARAGASAAPLVVMRRREDAGALPQAPQAPQTQTQTPAPGNDPYLQLTRYAAQQLYGPQRMVRALPGVFRVPLPRAPVALLRGGAVAAEPLVSWHGNGHYVTAVKLTNRSARPVTLDPRDLRGGWLAAAFQHARLLPAGTSAQSTCVYLISRRPFAETAPGWISVAAQAGR